MTAHLIRGDARQIPLKDRSVQAVICSPPYFGLRQYSTNPVIWGAGIIGGRDGCAHRWEATPELSVEAICLDCGAQRCAHKLADGPAVKPMTGGTGAMTGKQLRNNGSQFGNAWVEETRHGEIRTGLGLADSPASTRGGAKKARTIPKLEVTTATCTRCSAWRGELGSESRPQDFVAHLVEVFRECWRVLRDDGVAFVNMGDGYSGSGKGPSKSLNKANGHSQGINSGYVPAGTRPKSLLLVPERLAIALSDDGWIVRSRIAWCKAAPMPESVRDRPTSAWEHVWMLTKGPKYYWDADAVREEHKEPWRSTGELENRGTKSTDAGVNGGFGLSGVTPRLYNPAGRNQWNYWLLSPDSYSGAHFATYPRELVRRCVAAATSEYGACGKCSAPYRRMVERTAVPLQATYNGAVNSDVRAGPGRTRWDAGTGKPSRVDVQHLGWTPTCKCGPAAGVRPCVVLDPFSGSGTTAYVAASLGRVGIGVELSAEYTKQARYGRLAQDFLPLGAPA